MKISWKRNHQYRLPNVQSLKLDTEYVKLNVELCNDA